MLSNLVRIQVLSPEHVLVLSHEDVLFRTTNEGLDWHEVNSSVTMRTFRFVSPEFGFAIVSGEVMRTVDGGLTWMPTLPVAGLVGATLSAIYFVDELCGWTAGYNGVIARTIDGGRSWTTSRKPITGGITRIQFADRHCGWAVAELNCPDRDEIATEARRLWLGAGKPSGTEDSNWFEAERSCRRTSGLLQTSDGGAHWELVWVTPEPIGLSVNANNVFAVDQHRLFQSSDRGVRWSSREIPKKRVDGELWCIHFTSEHVGWIGGLFGVYGTTTGGASWLGGQALQLTACSTLMLAPI